MKRISLLIFCLLPVLGFSQFEITIKANVIDEETREPIQFANVEFLNKPLKEITREDGSFVLSYDENLVSEQDIFEVSAFGYESQDISAKQFYRFLTNTNKIFLRQKPGVENQVVKTKDEETTSVSNAPKALTGTISVKGIPVQGAKESIKNSFKEATSRRELLREARPGIIGSLEGLALALSLFFVLTVIATGGRLFAPFASISDEFVSPVSSSSSTTLFPRQRIVLDPDTLLKEDFARDGSSVFYGGQAVHEKDP